MLKIPAFLDFYKANPLLLSEVVTYLWNRNKLEVLTLLEEGKLPSDIDLTYLEGSPTKEKLQESITNYEEALVNCCRLITEVEEITRIAQISFSICLEFFTHTGLFVNDLGIEPKLNTDLRNEWEGKEFTNWFSSHIYRSYSMFGVIESEKYFIEGLSTMFSLYPLSKDFEEGRERVWRRLIERDDSNDHNGLLGYYDPSNYLCNMIYNFILNSENEKETWRYMNMSLKYPIPTREDIYWFCREEFSKEDERFTENIYYWLNSLADNKNYKANHRTFTLNKFENILRTCYQIKEKDIPKGVKNFGRYLLIDSKWVEENSTH